MPEGFIGRPLRRREDARFLTGAGRYTADIDAPGAPRLHVLRSPHAHARVLGIETGAARSMPGVRLVLTGADLEAAGLGPLPCPAAVKTIGPLFSAAYQPRNSNQNVRIFTECCLVFVFGRLRADLRWMRRTARASTRSRCRSRSS